jgi:hypothetical protein
MRKKESMARESVSVKGFKRFLEQVRPLYVIDHAGRAGNGFFQTLFDEHQEVLSIPWIHYCTSYFVTEFGDHARVDSSQAHEFWTSKSYFRFFYNELKEADRDLVYRFGGNPESSINRNQIREIFDQIVLSKSSVARKEIIYASFYAIAKGLGRDIETIKFIILTDSISLRMESVFDGFSGRIIDLAINDCPDARFIHLVRDPRAGFASTNHQFVNQLGNMYALRFSNITRKFIELMRCQLSMGGPFVFGFWTLYFVATFRAVEKKKRETPERFMTVRNEDLNLRFVPTMKDLAQDLGVTFNRIWDQSGYCPTMLGHEWKGTGGYSNRYQTKHSGPLQNDPDEVSRDVTGPNSYVTKRWKKRLSKQEIFILEYFFRHEIQAYGYEFLTSKPFGKTEASIWLKMLAPLRGEIPSMQWLFSGWKQSPKEFGNRITYYIVLPAFFVLARLVFLLSKSTRKTLFTRCR